MHYKYLFVQGQGYCHKLFAANHLHLLSCWQSFIQSVSFLIEFSICKVNFYFIKGQKKYAQHEFHYSISFQKLFLKNLCFSLYIFRLEVGQYHIMGQKPRFINFLSSNVSKANTQFQYGCISLGHCADLIIKVYQSLDFRMVFFKLYRVLNK